MAIVVEDGSVVTGANSYASIAEVRAYATERGVTLDADDAVVEVQMHKAMDWLEGYEDRFTGERYTADQELSWPRLYAEVHGFDVAYNAIPSQLIKAQAQLVVDVHNGVELQPTVTDTRVVTEEKVDVITVKYAEGTATAGATPGQPELVKAEMMLRPLLRSRGLYTVRV